MYNNIDLLEKNNYYLHNEILTSPDPSYSENHFYSLDKENSEFNDLNNIKNEFLFKAFSNEAKKKKFIKPTNFLYYE